MCSNTLTGKHKKYFLYESVHRYAAFVQVSSLTLIAGISRQVKTSQFLWAVVELLLDYIRKSNDRSGKVLDFYHPQTLKEMMAHCLDIPDEPQNIEQILSDCKETLKYCVKTGS